MNEKQYKFSFSKIATYLQCPKMYELQCVKNLIEFKENIYTTFGGAIHKAIELSILKKYDFCKKTVNIRKKPTLKVGFKLMY